MALAGVAADQVSKYLVVNNLTLHESVPVLGNALSLYFIKNSGAAFSLASGSTWIFSILASLVVIAIIVFARKIRSTAWAVVIGLLLGGVLGNLIDRLFREPSFGLGHVVDFISTPWLVPAVYNVADILIVGSMILFLILTFLGINIDGTRTPSKKQRLADERAAAEENTPVTVDDVHTEEHTDAKP
ncbi:signal peptidase II [Mycetocola spongiae]|uniref:signal peptidase II n=1 Tax=Mycetocola spongiae TaxID=2859226 RepID=UPI0021F4CBD3|nr:signal peptidase II [Mycetocola spongiae]